MTVSDRATWSDDQTRSDGPTRPRVVLGVSGGIAAYKTCLLLRSLTESGHEVRVVPTRAALEFVGRATWEALSAAPVTTDVWQDTDQVPHVRIGQWADLVVVAPATADLLARAAAGLADDLLTNVLLTARCPVLLAPAMHTEMWSHPATRENVATLRRRGTHVIGPADGRLTGADSGPGRMVEPAEIFQEITRLLSGAQTPASPSSTQPQTSPAQTSQPHRSPGDLAGRRVVVSAGGTREPLDPVRYLGNHSSGRQGVALAATAAARGARVTMVAANVELPVPDGIRVVAVGSAEQLRRAVLEAAPDADAVVMAAAVADFRPATVAENKIKKSEDDGDAPVIRLIRTADVLAQVVAQRPEGQLVVGFAAETGDADGDVLHHARRKLARKGCDLLVVNDVSGGRVFGERRNTVTVLGADGSVTPVPPADKVQVADVIWDLALQQPLWADVPERSR
ncbi:MAG: phosphopantothenoylcysteine decarboxylase / phosphopantothenate---cysteine ligase [Actinomycetota bacterium]|nr:phosphopantothenoylcysteine decarboxylase / phosphopantothenate---cysteine ligase [Actinomycetota bacterium]